MTEHTQCGFYLVGWIFHLCIAVLGLCSGTQLNWRQLDPFRSSLSIYLGTAGTVLLTLLTVFHSGGETSVYLSQCPVCHKVSYLESFDRFFLWPLVFPPTYVLSSVQLNAYADFHSQSEVK